MILIKIRLDINRLLKTNLIQYVKMFFGEVIYIIPDSDIFISFCLDDFNH